MKKIISLLSVFAMIATMFTTVAFADDNNKFYIEETVDGTNVTLTFGMLTNQTITSASGTLDATAALTACDNVTFAKAGATTFTVNTTQKVIAWTLADTAGQSGDIVLGTVTFENVKSDFTLPLKRAFVAKDDTKTSVVSSFTNEQVDYTVKAPVAEEVLPADRTAISDSFEAVVGDYVEITLTNKGTKTYALPSGVKGGSAKVAGMLKYTVNAEDDNAPAKGDVFTGYVKNINDAKKANLILTETVK